MYDLKVFNVAEIINKQFALKAHRYDLLFLKESLWKMREWN